LEAIHKTLHKELKVLEETFRDILNELEGHNITVKCYEKLSDVEQEVIKREFFEQIYPVIMPIAIDATHPFPHLNNPKAFCTLPLKVLRIERREII